MAQYGRRGWHQSILDLFSHPVDWLCFVHHFVAQCSYIRPTDDNFICCTSFTNFSTPALSLDSKTASATVNLPSTPPLPPPLLSAAPPSLTSPSSTGHFPIQQQQSEILDHSVDAVGYTAAGDDKTYDCWVFNAFSSPPSPST